MRRWRAGVGINVPLISMGVFALGACLAAVAGVVAGGFVGVYPGADFEILPYAFVVVIVGGMGSLKGAALGSLLVGLLDNFGKAFFPELAYFTLFAPMAVILAVRPTGLFGRTRERTRAWCYDNSSVWAWRSCSWAWHRCPLLLFPGAADPGGDFCHAGDEPGSAPGLHRAGLARSCGLSGARSL